jgi:hypothetical protein
MPNDPHIPWKFPIRRETKDRIEYALFNKDRKHGCFAGGGSVDVEVFLDGKWHWMKFATDGEGYRKLAALSERSRALLLDTLALVPVRGNLLPTTEKKRARGISKRDAGFWRNMDYWTPPARTWAETALAQKEKPTQLHRVIAAAKKSGLHAGNPDEIAAAVALLTWAAINTVNPTRFPLPRGTDLQKALITRISLKASQGQKISIWPEIEPIIAAVLNPENQAQRLRQHVPVLASQEEFGPVVPMTDFRGH